MEKATEAAFADLAAEALHVCANTHNNEARLIALLRKLDGFKPWPGEQPDLAHWLAHHGGLDLVTAREKVRVARALKDLPLISAALQSGELSYSKVRAITRIAEPESEDELVDLAREHTAESVVRIVRARRQGDHLGKTDAPLDAWKHRYLDCHQAQDGSVVFEGRLPAELGALLMQALERASDELFAGKILAASGDSADERPPVDADPERQPAQARRADAMALLAERYLATSPGAIDNPDLSTDAAPALSCNTADRFLVTVHASAEALCRGDRGTAPNNTCIDDLPTFEDGSVAAAATVRRLGCDASVVRILENARGEPLDVGRKTRVIPPAIRRALKSRDGGCRFPGCTHRRFIDGHHIVHWADGGETRLDNLVSVCRFHHRLLHEGDYRVIKDGEHFRFLRADGSEVLALPRKREGDRGGRDDSGSDVHVPADRGAIATRTWRPSIAASYPRPPP